MPDIYLLDGKIRTVGGKIAISSACCSCCDVHAEGAPDLTVTISGNQPCGCTAQTLMTPGGPASHYFIELIGLGSGVFVAPYAGLVGGKHTWSLSPIGGFGQAYIIHYFNDPNCTFGSEVYEDIVTLNTIDLVVTCNDVGGTAGFTVNMGNGKIFLGTGASGTAINNTIACADPPLVITFDGTATVT